MIIYGWGHFNRRDHSVVRGQCRSCGRQTYLKSYTSSKFATLYFIPVIPFGKEKIVSDCPHCKQAFSMPYGKWKNLHATDLPRMIVEYEQKPADEETAKSMLGLIYSLQDRPAMQRVGPQIQRAFAHDAKMLCLLGDVYSYLCLDKEADAVFLDVVGLTDDPEIAAVANGHLEAQKLKPPPPPNRLLQSLPVLILPLALLFGFVTLVQQAATSLPDNAYVVNGLSRPYTVVINGENISVKGFARARAPMVRYGRNSIRPGAEAGFLGESTFTADVSWWQRVFGSPVIVVNPDQAAVVMWERTGYSKSTVPDSAYQFRMSAGQTAHSFNDIDFPFQEFPSEITTQQSSGILYRTRVTTFDTSDTSHLIQILLGNDQTPVLQAHLRAKLRANDVDDSSVYLASHFLSAEDFAALAEPRLAARPVEMGWHRAYQNRFEGTPEGGDVVARYRALLEKEPDNSALAYLLGRMLGDPVESMPLFERATQMPQPNGYAFYGLAFHRIIDGDFAAAVAALDRALELVPGQQQFQSVRASALCALGAFEQLESEAGDLLIAKSPDYAAFHDHIYRLGKLGKVTKARMEIPLFLDRVNVQSALSVEQRASGEAYFESALAAATHNRAAFVDLAGKVSEPGYAFMKELAAGDLDAALKLDAANPDTAGLLGHLTLYTLLARAGRTTDAQGQLDQAITELAQGSATQKRWAAWLQGSEAPDARRAAHECYDIDNHAVYLVALAAKFPARAGDYLARARLLKYEDNVYTVVLDEVLKS